MNAIKDTRMVQMYQFREKIVQDWGLNLVIAKNEEAGAIANIMRCAYARDFCGCAHKEL